MSFDPTAKVDPVSSREQDPLGVQSCPLMWPLFPVAFVMPIRRHHRWLYPIDWRELSASIRFRRAKGRCEGCGRPHGRVVLHLGDGRWWDEEAGRWRDGAGKRVRRLPPPHSVVDRTRRTRVVLATCHRDHDPTNNDAANLMALCQRCHILHDKVEHLRRRRLTYLARRAIGDLFTGPYA